MAIYRDTDGQLVESDDDPKRLSEAGYSPATDRDIARHNSTVDYDEKGVLGQAAEMGATALKSATRTVESGLRLIDPSIPATDRPDSQMPLYGDEERFAAERHPIAEMAGQAATIAPLGLATGGLGAAPAMGLEAAAGGYAAEAEDAWKADRDFSQESALMNVGAGLVVGGGLMAGAAGVGKLTRMGRNLFSEAEHGVNARAADEIMERAAKGEAGSSADDIAKMRPDDAGVAYLRDNADTLTDEIATKQAKAAQELVDTYDSVSRLRPKRSELEELIPDNGTGQAQWVVTARQEAGRALELAEGEAFAPIREQLDALGDGSDPVKWFQRASELSDDLARARSLAPDEVDRARQVITDGLSQETLWGAAAKAEGQRASSYAARYGDHLEAFEEAFTTRVGGKRRVDPSKLRALADDAADPAARQAFDRTLESARTTADVAEKFGKKAEATRIRGAIDALERTQAQSRAVNAARKTVSRGTDSNPVQSAMEWLAREGSQPLVEEGIETMLKGGGAALGGLIGGAPGMAAGWLAGRAMSKRFGDRIVAGVGNAAADAVGGRLAARGSVFNAAVKMGKGVANANRAGVFKLLQTPIAAAEAGASAVRVAAPRAPLITSLNFDATREHIDKMASDPSYFGEVMSASMGSMNDIAPELFSDIAEHTAKVVSYLSAVAPGGKQTGPFPQTYPVGEDELWEFNQRARPLLEPDYLATELAAGRVTSQSMEAVQAVNPKAYGKLRIDVFERLRELTQQGVTIPIQAREQLDVLLDIDGGGDPALSWKVAERGYQAIARKNASKSQRPSAGNTDPSDTGMTSTALSTLSNGASAIAST